jgi:hypothetical protein
VPHYPTSPLTDRSAPKISQQVALVNPENGVAAAYRHHTLMALPYKTGLDAKSANLIPLNTTPIRVVLPPFFNLQ